MGIFIVWIGEVWGSQKISLMGYYNRAMLLFDLHRVINQISPNEPIHVLGYSLGGILLSVYAGALPRQVKSIMIAEGFGSTDDNDGKKFNVSQIFCKIWLQKIRNRDGYINKLMKDNPLLNYEKALYLSFFSVKKGSRQIHFIVRYEA